MAERGDSDDDIVGDDEEEETQGENLLTRVQRALLSQSHEDEAELESDICRMLKMFYLDMRVKG